jgi:hypothetical protein
MRSALSIAAALLCIVSMPGWIAAQKNARSDSDPTFFNPDYNNQGLENARPPSDIVLDVLLKRVEADEMSGEIEGFGREQKRALFEVVRVDLGPTSEEDYVVHGKPPMIGADCEWFWIVRVRQGKAEVILFSNGLSLALRKHATNGYRDIESDWGTAGFIGERLYSYSGSIYKLEWEHSKENK